MQYVVNSARKPAQGNAPTDKRGTLNHMPEPMFITARLCQNASGTGAPLGGQEMSPRLPSVANDLSTPEMGQGELSPSSGSSELLGGENVNAIQALN